MTQVFISHSSRRDPLAGQVRERLAEGLRAKNHEVKVDTDALRPGQDWCPTLFRWLADCDAAIILFNREALDSFWVRREVNVLMWRRALNPRLLVVPVLIGGLTSADVKDQGFSDVLPVQFARPPAEVSDISSIDSIVSQVLDEFAVIPDMSRQPDSMRRWIGLVADYLEGTRERRALIQAGRVLGIADEFLPDSETRQGSGQVIAQQMLEAAPGMSLVDAMQAIAPYLEDFLLIRLITQVAPAWISGEAARHLLPSEPGVVPHRRTVALNAWADQTGRQFVDRAMCLDFAQYWSGSAGGLPVGEDAVQETLEQCFTAIRRLCNLPDEMPLERARFRQGRLHFLILVVHGLRPHVVAEVLRELHRMTPELIIVLLTGDDLPAADVLREWGRGNTIVLTPALGPGEETLGCQLANDLRSIPERLNGSWR